MTEEDKRKKIAQALQALLQLSGATISVKEVVEKIKDRNIDPNNLNLMGLRDELMEDIKSSMSPVLDRKQEIKNFLTENWELIKENKVIRDILVGAYCKGRYNKQQREDLLRDLMSEVSNYQSTTLDHREFNF